MPAVSSLSASASASASPSTSAIASESAPEYVNALMLNFRELVIGLQDEGDQLRHKLADIKTKTRHTKAKINNLQKQGSQTAAAAAIPKELTINTRAPPQAPPPPPQVSIRDRIARVAALSNNRHDIPWSYTEGRLDTNNNQNHNNYNRDQNNHNHNHSHHHKNNHNTQFSSTAANYSSSNLSKHYHLKTKHEQNPHRTMTSVGVAAKARGVLIVLEGLDRVGKSTLAQKLVDHLEKTRRDVTYCRFPDRTTQVGQLIDGFLKSSSKRVDNHVMHLLFSANRWELSKRIRNTLIQGTTVIVDRYSYSGIAYSSSEKELPLKWCLEMEKGLPQPDLVIYLNLPREAQYQRPGFGDERYETKERQESVRIQYERVMELSKETWLKVDVDNKSPDQVLGEVIMPVKRCLESCSMRELGTLDFFESATH